MFCKPCKRRFAQTIAGHLLRLNRSQTGPPAVPTVLSHFLSVRPQGKPGICGKHHPQASHALQSAWTAGLIPDSQLFTSCGIHPAFIPRRNRIFKLLPCYRILRGCRSMPQQHSLQIPPPPSGRFPAEADITTAAGLTSSAAGSFPAASLISCLTFRFPTFSFRRPVRHSLSCIRLSGQFASAGP